MTATTSGPRPGHRHTLRWTAAGAALLLAVLGIAGGCSTVGYLAQSAGGHISLMNAARPVQRWLDDAATPAELRERLALSQRMRDFAVRELKLPDNSSYRRYADLKRNAAVWNVVAAPELSLTLKTWCFPVVGCIGYRGYFDRAGAEELAAALKSEGQEVAVYGVPAYSTLGWTNWLGGDPLLNTFLNQQEVELARLIFHELAHQVAYAAGDTVFNESFATAVERIGGERWMLAHTPAAAREVYARLDARRNDFRALTSAARSDLQAIYQGAGSEAAKREAKAARMARLRTDYNTMKAQAWGGFAGYDGWFERANNASLALQGAYYDQVPAFEKLFDRQGRDFARFYAEVQRLARLPKAERDATLQAL